MASLEAQIQQQAAAIRKIAQINAALKKQMDDLIAACVNRPKTLEEEIESIEGRRVYYNLVDTLDFTIQQDGLRFTALSFTVSQDGPFIMTAYPLVAWKPSAPSNATNFGQWSPVYSWPVPTQQKATQDSIDLSYEMFDGGSQRAFQNETAPPLFSRPDYYAPLPRPVIFAPNAVPQFIPTFQDIFFDPDADEVTTGGTLVVSLVGYRIVNL
jgi:hypothetical protein